LEVKKEPIHYSKRKGIKMEEEQNIETQDIENQVEKVKDKKEPDINIPENINMPPTFEALLDEVKKRSDAIYYVENKDRKPLLVVYAKERNYNLEKLMEEFEKKVNGEFDRIDVVVLGEYDKIEVIPRAGKINKKKTGRKIEL